jgi:transposase
MPSDYRTDTQQHYKDFHMDIDFRIPARLKVGDGGSHRAYSRAVAELIEQGANSYAEVSRALGISYFLVCKMAKAQGIRPSAALHSRRIDPLNHPRVDLEIVRKLRRQDMTYIAIAGVLGVSLTTLRSVVKAARSMTGETLTGQAKRAPKGRPWRKVKTNYLDHPRVPAAKVKAMLEAGNNLHQIATAHSVAVATVRKVIDALCASGALSEKTRRRHRLIDRLHNPKCPVEEVQRLEALGYTHEQIASALGVCEHTVRGVIQAVKHSALTAASIS